MYYRKRLKSIKAMLFDLDGVFANGYLQLAEGQELINAKDGFAIKYAITKGFYVGIITGGTSDRIKRSFSEIGVTDVYLGERFKTDALEDFCAKYTIPVDDVLYMGDDLPDYEVLKAVGFSACPADAANEIMEIVDYISDKNGGKGCVRDIIEQVMKVQEKWNLTDFKN